MMVGGVPLQKNTSIAASFNSQLLQSTWRMNFR